MRELSYQTISRILKLHFKGLQRDEIARRTGVSTGTVSNVIALLPESLRELRTLSVELRKSGRSSGEALVGARLNSKLADLDVEPDQLQRFIPTFKKICRKARYQPEKVMQASMKLSDLEEISEKSYPEAIEDFECKTKQVKELEDRKLTLEDTLPKLVEEIESKEKELKEELKRNRITEKEIEYIDGLRQSLRKYGITLGDARNLQEFLENMEEMGGNPKKFVEYTRRFGSLRGNVVNLEGRKQRASLELKSLNIKKKACETALNKLRDEKSELKERVKEKREELAKLLSVKDATEEIAKAVNANMEKLAELEGEVSVRENTLRSLETQIDESERKKQTLQREIEEMLKIKNYVTARQKAIQDLEQEETKLGERVRTVLQELATLLQVQPDVERVIKGLETRRDELKQLDQQIVEKSALISASEAINALLAKKPYDRDATIKILQQAKRWQGYSPFDNLIRRNLVRLMAEQGFVPVETLNSWKWIAKKRLTKLEECTERFRKKLKAEDEKLDESTVKRAANLIAKFAEKVAG